MCFCVCVYLCVYLYVNVCVHNSLNVYTQSLNMHMHCVYIWIFV